jgi:membrane protein
MLFVFISAASLLVLTWAVVVGPVIAARFDPSLTQIILRSTWLGATLRYGLAVTIIGGQLFAFHLWLAAGKRRIKDVWPGVLLSMLLWLALASLYSYYLNFSDYTRFYAGLSQLMIALIFFQMTAVIVILGAELNRGIFELKRLGAAAVIENHANGAGARAR